MMAAHNTPVVPLGWVVVAAETVRLQRLGEDPQSEDPVRVP